MVHSCTSVHQMLGANEVPGLGTNSFNPTDPSSYWLKDKDAVLLSAGRQGIVRKGEKQHL